MSDVPAREFGRDGVSGLVDKDRALRARLIGRPRAESVGRPPKRIRDDHGHEHPDGDPHGPEVEQGPR